MTRQAVHQALGNPTEVGDCLEGANWDMVIVLDDPVGVGDVGVVCHGRGGGRGWRGRGDFFMREEGALAYRTICESGFCVWCFFAASGVKTDFSTSSYVEK